jgi:drug/metabolite transporter (DMT)-like permease
VIAVVGGLGAAAIFAISTLCSSELSRRVEPMIVMAGVTAAGAAILAPVIAVQGLPHVTTQQIGWLAASGFGYLAGLRLAYAGLATGQVGIVAPLMSTEGAVAATISLLAGQALPLALGLALGVVILGVILAGTNDAPATRGDRPRTAAALALLAAVCFGIGLYATGRAGSELPLVWAVLPARLIGASAIALPLALRGRLRLPAGTLPLVLVSGVCEVLGYASFALGARDNLAVASVLSSLFGAFSSLLALVLFSQRLRGPQVVGVLMIVAGVAAVAAANAAT